MGEGNGRTDGRGNGKSKGWAEREANEKGK